jgi:lipopolysaccharide/colanic/teichoic acid biosynthesis glycosyltransferase
MKRLIDIAVALAGLAVVAPLAAAIALAVWIGDHRSPWFRGLRVARGGGVFRMLKFRSMRPGASKTGVNSTAAGDRRVTAVGRFLRRHKLDELPQLVNVLLGDMSLVGPRPQVERDAALYTDQERRMLSMRPGITDIASIVFADEAEILAGSADPDLLYNQIIRPWKSRLALLYVDHASFSVDAQIVFLMGLALVSRRRALDAIARLLLRWRAGEELCAVARRIDPLRAYPPPGAARVVERYGDREPDEEENRDTPGEVSGDACVPCVTGGLSPCGASSSTMSDRNPRYPA